MKSNANSKKEFFLAASISFPFKKGCGAGVGVVFKHDSIVRDSQK